MAPARAGFIALPPRLFRYQFLALTQLTRAQPPWASGPCALGTAGERQFMRPFKSWCALLRPWRLHLPDASPLAHVVGRGAVADAQRRGPPRHRQTAEADLAANQTPNDVLKICRTLDVSGVWHEYHPPHLFTNRGRANWRWYRISPRSMAQANRPRS
uniref:Uncharacterized protein n=1 Tax=mine drainage metagenome TaxID=410659 RepID=E6QE21_9ZZZZ